VERWTLISAAAARWLAVPATACGVASIQGASGAAVSTSRTSGGGSEPGDVVDHRQRASLGRRERAADQQRDLRRALGPRDQPVLQGEGTARGQVQLREVGEGRTLAHGHERVQGPHRRQHVLDHPQRRFELRVERGRDHAHVLSSQAGAAPTRTGIVPSARTPMVGTTGPRRQAVVRRWLARRPAGGSARPRQPSEIDRARSRTNAGTVPLRRSPLTSTPATRDRTDTYRPPMAQASLLGHRPYLPGSTRQPPLKRATAYRLRSRPIGSPAQR
jgi:hypothetical protein